MLQCTNVLFCRRYDSSSLSDLFSVAPSTSSSRKKEFKHHYGSSTDSKTVPAHKSPRDKEYNDKKKVEEEEGDKRMSKIMNMRFKKKKEERKTEIVVKKRKIVSDSE